MACKTYEIFTEYYSRIVQADTIGGAFKVFWLQIEKTKEEPEIIAIVEHERGKEFLSGGKQCNIANVMRWVDASQTPPDTGSWVLVHAPSGRHIAWWNGLHYEDRADYTIDNVTHWCEMLKPPCA